MEGKHPKEQWVDDALMPWDEVWVLAQAIEKANSLDPMQAVKVLQSMTKPGSLKTTFGPGYMGGLKTYGVNGLLVRPMPITVIQGEKIKMVSGSLPWCRKAPARKRRTIVEVFGIPAASLVQSFINGVCAGVDLYSHRHGVEPRIRHHEDPAVRSRRSLHARGLRCL